MSHQIFIENQHIKTESELQRDLHRAALLFQKCADYKVLFIYSSNKEAVPEAYETYFGSENFMHLSGYKVRTGMEGHGTAKAFYRMCLKGD